MLQKSKAITLYTVKYGESGVIAHLYSENFGRLSFLIHGVRKKSSLIDSNLLQPLALLDIDFYYKKGRDLQRIKELKPFIYLKNIRFDIRKSTISIFLCEILNKTLHEAEANKEMFNFLFSAIQLLDLSEKGIENFHLIFLLQFSKFLGIYPVNNEDVFFNDAKSNINMHRLLQYSLTDTTNLVLDHDERQELLDMIMVYFRTHLAGLGQIQSLKILREVFQK